MCNKGVCWGVGVSLCPMQKKWRSATDGSGIVPQHQQLPAAPAASALTTLPTTHTHKHTHTTELSNSQQPLLQLSLLMKVQLCVHHNIINMFCAVLQSRYHHTVIPSTVNLIQFNKMILYSATVQKKHHLKTLSIIISLLLYIRERTSKMRWSPMRITWRQWE